MSRHLLTVTVLLVFPLLASAQIRAGRVGGFGGGVRPSAPLPNSFYPTLPSTPIGGGATGGFMKPGVHRPGLPGFWGGGWFPYYGYADPVYPYPPSVNVFVEGGTDAQVQPPETRVDLSGEATAVLVLEFPADAEIWVNDKKGEGKPHTEWTLASPPLKTGSEFTFNVKAQWMAKGKTYTYERTITVAAGNRSRSLVLSGTEIKE